MKPAVTVSGKQLSFWEKANEVVALAQAGRGIVVMPTGTGKTTQTPQALHEAGFTQRGMIYISVPRRVLAVELASRVAEEMGVKLGDLVGYQIRGESRFSRSTRILFVTEGILRAKIIKNPTLAGVSVVLFDEFHQRSLMGDFNAALVERAQQQGSQVAFLLMSATIDPAHLAEHFSCDVADGSALARTFPIEERFVEPDSGDRDGIQAAINQVSDLIHADLGNGIVFMPGKNEIARVIEGLRKAKLPDWVTVLPLHGELSPNERHAPFATRPGVTVTIATDVVETGATLPDIGWVVDSGLARENRYDPISDTSTLGVCEIAQDRLGQRGGRCGRVRSGVCVRLFSRENKEQRPLQTLPEIFRVPLREVVLNIKELGLSREDKPIQLIDSPPKANWKMAKHQLQLLGFVDETPEAAITDFGRQAVELGCDPREAAMLLKAAELGCLREMALVIAARQSHRFFYRPKGEEWEADQAQSAFRTSEVCDAWAIVKAVTSTEKRTSESLGEWCRQHYVSYVALKDIWMVSKQLLSAMEKLGYPANEHPGTDENLAQAILAGLPDRVFTWKGRRDWFVHAETEQEGCLARSSSITKRVSGMQLAVWEILQLPNITLITNAVVVKANTTTG